MSQNMQCPRCEQMDWRSVRDDVRNMCTKQGAVRLFVLLWAIACCVVSYSVYAFVIYLDAFRDTFHMSQSQAEFAMSLVWLGMGSPIVLGCAVHRWGPRVGAFIALVLATGAYCLLYTACLHASWFSDHVYLPAFFCLITGAGSGATAIAAISAANANFTDKYRGTLMMFLTSGVALGSLLFKILYNDIFNTDHNKSITPVHLANYFLMVGIVFAVFNFGGIFFFGTYLHSDNADEQSNLLSTTSASVTGSNESIATHDTDTPTDVKTDPQSHNVCQEHGPQSPSMHLTLRQTLCSPKFHMLAWPCVITQGLYAMTVNNVVVFLESFNLLEWRVVLPYAADISQMVNRPLIGIGSDVMASRIDRSWHIVIGCIINCIVYALDIVLLDRVWLLFINMILLGYPCVATFTVTPALLSMEFGIETFPRNWGLIQGTNCVAMFICCNIIGIFYQLHLDDVTQLCQTITCFEWPFIIATCTSTIGAILIIGFVWHKRRDNQ